MTDRLESSIRDEIFEYLTKRYPPDKAFFWKDRQGTTKPGRGTFRGKNNKGIPDILGVFRRPGQVGQAIAIEVKRPSGDLSLAQFNWLEAFRKAGGIVIVATSVENVQAGLQ